MSQGVPPHHDRANRRIWVLHRMGLCEASAARAFGSGRARPARRNSAIRRHTRVAGELADFAPVGQSVFCQGWQLCVKNAPSLGWIATT